MRNDIRDKTGKLIGWSESRNDGSIALRNSNGTLLGTEDKQGITRNNNGTKVASGKGSLYSLLK